MPRWNQEFRKLVLKDGRKIGNLHDARLVMLTLPESHLKRPPWVYATELLVIASERNEKYATKDARAQLTRALTVEGLL